MVAEHQRNLFIAGGIALVALLAILLIEGVAFFPSDRRQFEIKFPFDTAEITSAANDVLSEVAAAAKADGTMTIRIVAHTDTLREEGYNQSLSEDRADAAKSNLIGKGIAAHRIETEPRGEIDMRKVLGDGVRHAPSNKAMLNLE